MITRTMTTPGLSSFTEEKVVGRFREGFWAFLHFSSKILSLSVLRPALRRKEGAGQRRKGSPLSGLGSTGPPGGHDLPSRAGFQRLERG